MTTVSIFVDRFDTIFGGWVWDLRVDASGQGIKFWFTRESNSTGIYIDQGYVELDLPLAENDMLWIFCKSLKDKRQFSCMTSVAPLSAPQIYLVKPMLSSGSLAVTESSGDERTAPSGSIASSTLAGGKVGIPLVAQGEAWENVTVTGNSPVNKASKSRTTTTTTTVETVSSVTITRSMAIPSISSDSGGKRPSYG